MVIAVLVILGAWELRVRGLGYGPSYNDTPMLWRMSRDRLRTLGPDAVVIIGASRIRFDLDHAIVSEAFEGAPIVNLSMNGSVVRPVLHELAMDESFRGTVLCGYTPGLFWMPGGPLLGSTHEWMAKAARATPAQRWGQRIIMVPESVIAFLKDEELALGPALRRFLGKRTPNREGVRLPPEYPPYISHNAADRRNVMWSKLETDPAFQQRLQNIWKGLFSMMQPLPPELVAGMRAEVAADVERIRNRGGEVIFLSFPTSGWIREYEGQIMPDSDYWVPLLEATGSPGLNSKDHPELDSFECPEWSHLSGGDAEEFSRRAMKRLQELLAER